jgi:hypothetical protein
MPDPGASSVSPRNALDFKKVGRLGAQAVAWVWFLMAGVGGLILLIHEGPLPITNGWFAMFSGVAWCPGTAWLLRKYANVRVSMGVQFLTAFLIMLAGRIAVVVILHRPFLPHR